MPRSHSAQCLRVSPRLRSQLQHPTSELVLEVQCPRRRPARSHAPEPSVSQSATRASDQEMAAESNSATPWLPAPDRTSRTHRAQLPLAQPSQRRNRGDQPSNLRGRSMPTRRTLCARRRSRSRRPLPQLAESRPPSRYRPPPHHLGPPRPTPPPALPTPPPQQRLHRPEPRSSPAPRQSARRPPYRPCQWQSHKSAAPPRPNRPPRRATRPPSPPRPTPPCEASARRPWSSPRS